MSKLKDRRKRHSSPQNASYAKKANVSSTSERKLIKKCSQENKLAKSTDTPPFDDSSENNTQSLLKKEKKTTTKPNIICEQPMPSLADLEKMFEDSENSQQLSLTTSITSEKCEKSHLIQKSNANDMPSSMDKTLNKNIMLNESSISNNYTTLELEHVNRNSNFQIKKAFDNKPSSIAIPCRTCKTNHVISKIIDCQNPSQMKTFMNLSNAENDHVNNTGTGMRHHRMSHYSCDSADSTKAVINEYQSLPSPSSSRDNNTILKRFRDSLHRYGVDSPNFPEYSEESNRLLSEIIRKFCLMYLMMEHLTNVACFKIKLMHDFIKHESRNNPINSSLNELYNLSHDNCCSKIEVNSGEMLNRKSKQTSNSSQINLGNCPICMDNLVKHFAVSTLCGPIFCLECITAAIAANGQKCPTCRKSLSYPGYHPLFLKLTATISNFMDSFF